ncbi:MAG: periplasmic heavy metal sensor [Nitrospirales bacterium]|nr:periplasmic heavy metal sensor [Nitrospirales bacterium]
MALIPTVKNPFRHEPGRKGGLILLTMVFALSAFAHAGKGSTDEKRPHEAYTHQFESQHASQNYVDHHHFSSTMEEELKLTDEQKEAFHRLRLDYDKMVVKKTADVRTAEVDLATLLGKDEPDRQAIEEQVKAIGAIKEDMMMARIDSLLKLRSVLSKDQYGKFREILHQRMNQVEGHSPHGGM